MTTLEESCTCCRLCTLEDEERTDLRRDSGVPEREHHDANGDDHPDHGALLR
jgi:hypothetical protein